MDFDGLVRLYDERKKVNPRAYEDISSIFDEIYPIYEDWARNTKKVNDVGQSWRAWKGKNFEKLVFHVVIDLLTSNRLPVKLVRGDKLEKEQTDTELSRVKRNILIDFGKQGCFVPDADIVIYSPNDASIIAIISCKITLRERIAQTGFWKLKLRDNPLTRNIKVYFVTPDEDGTLVGDRTNKSKAIALHELDGNFVLRSGFVEQTNLKKLERIVEELKKCL